MISSLRGRCSTVGGISGASSRSAASGLDVAVTPANALRLRSRRTRRRCTRASSSARTRCPSSASRRATSSTSSTLLLGVTGVGPKSALGVLAALSPGEIAEAVAADDDAVVPQGRRASARRPRSSSSCPSPASSSRPSPVRRGTIGTAAVADSVLAALIGLGWSERVAAEAVDDAVGRDRGEVTVPRCCACAGDSVPRSHGRGGSMAVTARPVTTSDVGGPDVAIVGRARIRGRARVRGRAAPEQPRGVRRADEGARAAAAAAGRRSRSSSAPPDHILLAGPPGPRQDHPRDDRRARERAAAAHVERPRHPARGRPRRAPVSSLVPGEVLFIDEIHRMARSAEEMLYLAMEDFRIDIMVGKGAGATSHPARSRAVHPGRGDDPVRAAAQPAARPLRLHRAPRVLRRRRARAGARTRRRACSSSTIDREALAEIAGRCRGTPRIANRLLRRVRDYALVHRADAGLDAVQRGPRPLRRRRARPRPARPRRDADHPHAVRRRTGRA